MHLARLWRPLAGLLLALPVAAAGAQEAGGTVSGRVTLAGSDQPLQGARVSIVGTSLVTGTSAEGRYVFRAVPAGTHEVRVLMIGFGAAKKSVAVTPSAGAVADFALERVAVQLEAMVTTATGVQTSRSVANNIARIDAAKTVEEGPVANMSDLLVAKAPGVQVLGGNLTGAGQRIRIRGTSSLSLNNEPIVVMDGVRIKSDNNSSSIGIGGTNPSRLSDLNAEEIESIEVVKGPAAATLYGTDAANGVIVITTKRGKAGKQRISAYAERGAITDRNGYPVAYRSWRSDGTPSSQTNTRQCFLTQVAAGTCTQDSVTAYNLFEDGSVTPLGTGSRQQYGLQLSGGSELAQYFVSGEWEDEVGLTEMSGLFRNQFRQLRGYAAPDEFTHPNAYRRTSVRANVNAALSSKFDLGVQSAFITSAQRLPQTDNNVTGLLSNALGGLGYRDSVRFGFRAYTPTEIFADNFTQNINRFIGSSTANYRPTSWLSSNATLGIDFTSRNESDLCIRDLCTPFGTRKLGFKRNNRAEFFQYTANLSGAATFRPFASLESRTTAGVQYVGDRFARNGAYGENIPTGGTQAGSGALQQVEELGDETRTLGIFVEQMAGYRDRIFLTGALRVDDNSAFGANFSAVYYPKASLSWVVSEEPFFPKSRWVSNLRLRTAYGTSGVQPGTTDAQRYFIPTTVSENGTDVPAITFNAFGNPDLKPERSGELEGGFDALVINGRVRAEFTGYRRRTKDALIAAIIAPSVGVSSTQFRNIGAVQNSGIELLLDSRLIDRSWLGWQVTFNASRNTNEILDLGDTPAQVSATRRQTEGYPINGYWQRKIRSYSDANGDGIISLSELVVDDSATYVGPDTPLNEYSLTNSIDLLNNRLHLRALIDRKSGHYLNNGTDRIRCESRNNCRGAIDPTAPFFEQARAVAVREHASHTQAGFMEKADFTRLREVSATYDLPENWARAVRAERLSFTAAGRNLAIWTKYTGIDPESNYFEGARGTVSDFQTSPPPTYFTVRLNVGF